jgi:CubicO group peptidase (beta-lactamase class C family)
MSLQKGLAQLLLEQSLENKFSGVVLIQREDVKLFEGAYGYANRSWKVKNRVDTRFRIASISKMFTAAAVLKLIEGGKLRLDASIVECLGLLETKIPTGVTIYHLLTMTSGIADWFDESGNWEEDWAALCREHPIYLFRRHQDYLPLFLNEPPVFPSGEKHLYNGAGYILLGLLVEKLSGLSYTEFVQENILKPVGMSRSGFPALDDPAQEVAEGYIQIIAENEKVIGWKKNIYSTTPDPVADGGATSTAPDLVRFSQALRSGSLLSSELTGEMLSPKVLSNEDKFRGYTWMYGYANYFILDQDERIVRWGHTGEEDGVSCRLYYYPIENLDVIILGNQSWCAGSLGWKIHDLILESAP